MSIDRAAPPRVAQTLSDSCWAAVLESWSRVDPRITPQQSQTNLIATYGEGSTGGITPATKVPVIAQALNLRWGGFAGADLGGYINNHLAQSHLFCAYTVGQYTHSVLLYRLNNGTVSFMDPDGGRWRRRAVSWLAARGPLVLMRIP